MNEAGTVKACLAHGGLVKDVKTTITGRGGAEGGGLNRRVFPSLPLRSTRDGQSLKAHLQLRSESMGSRERSPLRLAVTPGLRRLPPPSGLRRRWVSGALKRCSS